ncbi:hypothetical protein H7J06_17055 [Mycobacterium hodleri]|uniref:hypothetical protein n=1 Tax=Mycolicibacterium hodleri TaxID=49897 RepID=UPI0021F3624D|nr:hypothetical protein [Mycolicibacterium hodleri]MCV7134698.1 hypothetical protein [Mycolicibacterium hodleri]
MHRTPSLTLSAVTLVAALWLGGCAEDPPTAAPQSPRPLTGTLRPAMPTVAPLPPLDQLTAVLYRLADTSIPAEQKVALVQYATVDDEPALKNFGEALVASGFAPLTVDAADLQWAGEPGHVVASVTIGSPNPQVRPFTFPMEFAPIRNSWQLSKRTADQLLPLVGAAPPPAPPG